MDVESRQQCWFTCETLHVICDAAARVCSYALGFVFRLGLDRHGVRHLARMYIGIVLLLTCLELEVAL
jgi:hypothetical protein